MRALGRGVDARDELVLGIALKGRELMAGRARQATQALLDRCKRVAAVDLRFAAAEQVEVRAVE